MRAWIAALVMLAACKGKAATKLTLAVPSVTAPVVATDAKVPPVVVIVGDSDDATLAAAATWADFDAHNFQIARRSGPLDLLSRYAVENCAKPLEVIKTWDKNTRTAVDVHALEAALDARDDTEDPPPPGEADDVDYERMNGNYKMKKPEAVLKRERDQAIERARDIGILSRFGGRAWALPDDDGRPNNDGTPRRLAHVEGDVVLDAPLEKLCMLIAVAPTTKATRLIDVLERTDGAIAISHGGKVRPLNIEFRAYHFTGFGYPSRYTVVSSEEPWLEVRVSANNLVVEAVSDTPIEVAKPEQLAETILAASDARGVETDALLDVLVDPDVDAQRLIDVLVALDTAGAGTIGLGQAPTGEELARRGHRMPTLRLGQPAVQGDLDKAKIRKVMKQHRAALRACYEPQLIESPELAGTVSTQFFITPQGTVATATASGVAVPVALCVQDVIAKLVFPKPNGTDGVQVNYPFTFRPY